MVKLVINSIHNVVRLEFAQTGGESRVHRFVRRWSGVVLGQLLLHSGRGQPLSAEALQQHLLHLGQAQPLNRAQVQRVVQDVQAFLDLHPVLQMQLHHAPRKASVGPWLLATAISVDWSMEGDSAMPAVRQSVAWPYPQLLCTVQAPVLRSLLSQILVSDGFSIEGKHLQALEVLTGMETLFSSMTPEACALVQLRRANLLRRMGRFCDVAQALRPALVGSAWRDPGIPERARICQQRAQYDEHPGLAWQTILATPQAPMLHSTPDPVASLDWHNLMALTLRRKMHAAAQPMAESAQCHALALRHLEAALYFDLCLRSWDTLQAHISNLAYHLQQAIPLGLATVQEVHDWHVLSIACAEKLDSGRDSVWEVIFFAEFWLDHCADSSCLAATSSLLISEQLHPSQDSYYQRALQRIATCGDIRQTATAHIAHLRWAQRYQPLRQIEIAQTLSVLLDAHPSLSSTLAQEGYAQWLP